MYLNLFRCNARIIGSFFTRILQGIRHAYRNITGTEPCRRFYDRPQKKWVRLFFFFYWNKECDSLTVSVLLACCSMFHSSICIHCTKSLCYWSPWRREHVTGGSITVSVCFFSWESVYDKPTHLRQCVIDVFCSTSTERSRKSSSLLLTCKTAMKVECLFFPWLSQRGEAFCFHSPTSIPTLPAFEMCFQLRGLCLFTEQCLRCLQWLLMATWLSTRPHNHVNKAYSGPDVCCGEENSPWCLLLIASPTSEQHVDKTTEHKKTKTGLVLHTVSQFKHRVSLVSVPWKISWTHVGSALFSISASAVTAEPLFFRRPFCFSCFFSSCRMSATVFSR